MAFALRTHRSCLPVLGEMRSLICALAVGLRPTTAQNGWDATSTASRIRSVRRVRVDMNRTGFRLRASRVLPTLREWAGHATNVALGSSPILPVLLVRCALQMAYLPMASASRAQQESSRTMSGPFASRVYGAGRERTASAISVNLVMHPQQTSASAQLARTANT